MRKKKKHKDFIDTINEQEYRIIKELAFFNQIKPQQNLKEKYYEERIKGKYHKYTVHNDLELGRNKGWVDSSSLGKASATYGAIYTKINRLIEQGIVEMDKIRWNHYKDSKKEKTKIVYRLVQNDNDKIFLISRIIEKRNPDILGDHVFFKLSKMLEGDKVASYEDYMKSVVSGDIIENNIFIENTDYFKVLSKETQFDLLYALRDITEMEKDVIEIRLARFNNILKKDKIMAKKAKEIDRWINSQLKTKKQGGRNS
jgi:hypothetical protein